MDNNLKVFHFAAKAHADVNHYYNDGPYAYHLQAVGNVAIKFKHLIPKEDQDSVIQACYCHDLIEDTRLNYNDVKSKISNLNIDYVADSKLDNHSKLVADIVYAVTNEKGRNRKERANDKYYQGIRETKYATFVKLCDRIANMQYGKSINSSQYKMYCKEWLHFKASLWDSLSMELYKEMFDYIENSIMS